MEELQNFLPQRVPSRLDWALNMLGTLLGALLAWGCIMRARSSAGRRCATAGSSSAAPARCCCCCCGRSRCCSRRRCRSASARRSHTLPMLVADALADTAWAVLGRATGELDAAPLEPLSTAAESMAVMLGLLAPCLLALSVARAGLAALAARAGHRGGRLCGHDVVDRAELRPEHALSWRTAAVSPAFIGGLIVARCSSCCRAARRQGSAWSC